MGNHISKRKSRRNKCWYGQPEGDLSDNEHTNAEDFEDPTPESYDKLIAWMIEMAENDEADLSSPAFVEQITTSCAEKHQQTTAKSVPPFRSVPSTRHSIDTPERQYSLDSNSSSHSKSSMSREDLPDPKTRFRRTMLSRQSTIDFSDDSDALLDKVSSDSFDNDTDANYLTPYTIVSNNIEETSFTSRFRPPLRKNQSCTTYRNYSTSISDLLNVGSRKKSKSLMTMRKMLSETRNDDEITPITEETVVKILDNDMLDGNMADILYSVEALWPKNEVRNNLEKGLSFN